MKNKLTYKRRRFPFSKLRSRPRPIRVSIISKCDTAMYHASLRSRHPIFVVSVCAKTELTSIWFNWIPFVPRYALRPYCARARVLCFHAVGVIIAVILFVRLRFCRFRRRQPSSLVRVFAYYFFLSKLIFSKVGEKFSAFFDVLGTHRRTF